MGKKRSVSVSRVAELLIAHRPSGFMSDFEENKKLVSEMMQLPSKAARNKIAGHITHRAPRLHIAIHDQLYILYPGNS